MSGQIDKLLPYGIGGIAVLAFLLFVARPYFTTLAGDAAKATPGAARKLYRRLRPVGGRKLQRYRNQVRAENSKAGLGLAQAQDSGGRVPGVRDVYVPLQCEVDGGRADAATRLRGHRVMLLGAPGAGKSLLLKHEMLEWADDGDDGVLPVIVNLHGFNTKQEPFKEFITRKFETAGLPPARAADMVETRLDDGTLRVFFDGLDEVGADLFERVIQQLREFSVQYGKCAMAVSCRTAAYEGHLQDQFDEVVRVAEFDDASILRFLSKWPDFKDSVTAARVFQALQEDPELKVLARSPLMLTMIAYLQSGDRAESVGPLPNSRARFYATAVTHLLDRDRLLNRKEAIGNYHAGRKSLVLERLALTQLRESSARGDRQEITRARFESVIEELLPGFDMERTPHLHDLLEEIVSRSELIKDIDRGRHYQFTHLTLLEYLAACALRTDEQRLMEHYRRAPQPWRETVRMWCAETRGDCTRVVREIFDDPDTGRKVLALQCLADAVHIEESLAAEILTFFLERLGAPDDVQGAVSKGLGTLAASGGPRGRRVRTALIAAARTRVGPRRSAALRALTVSGRQESAHALVRFRDAEARAALQAMGDVAVPSLAREAEQGAVWAARSLGAVGTPAAAVRLAELLWRADEDVVARTAAWQLASLLRSPDAWNELSEWTLPSNAVHFNQYEWLWDSFSAPPGLKTIAARVAWLMGGGTLDSVVLDDPQPALGVTEIHTHIGIPLFACRQVGRSGQPDWALAEREFRTARQQSAVPLYDYSDRRVLVDRLFSARQSPIPTRALKQLRNAVLAVHDVPETHRAVLRALPWDVQAELMVLRFGTGHSGHGRHLLQKWRQLHEQPDPPVALRVVATLAAVPLTLLAVALSGTRLVAAMFGWAPGGLSPWGPPWLAVTVALTLTAAIGVLQIVGKHFRDEEWADPVGVTAVLALMACIAYGTWLALASGRDLVGWPVTLTVTALLAGTCVTGFALAGRINEKRDNPLRTVLAAAPPHPALRTPS